MKIKLSLLWGIALAALSASCTQDVEVVVPQPKPDGAIAINVSGSITQTYTTRVDDGGFCDGDQIGLFGVNYTDNNSAAGTLVDEGNQVDNARYTYDEANHTWTSSGNIYYKDAETNIDLYAYYPYASVGSVAEYAFEVAQDQSGANGVDGYAQSDFLWAKAENITPSEKAVKLRFAHRLSCVNVVLTEGSGFEAGEWDALDKSVLVMNTARTAAIDMATGVATATGEVPMEGIVMKSGGDGYRAIVVPQSVAAGKALLSITVDGIAVRFKKDAVLSYEAGKQTQYTIKVSKKAHSGDYELKEVSTTIIDWVADLDSNGGEAKQYYVVHLDEAGTLEATIKADGKNPAKIKNLKVTGKICGADFYFMRDKMDILQAVNLKESTIVGSWYYEINMGDERGWFYEYFEGDMPESEEECRQMVSERYPNIQYFGSRVVYGYADEIPADALRDKSTLTTFVFPERVTKIGSSAFYGCSLLSGALIIPDDVTVIEREAFYGCSNYSSLSLPYGLKEIGESAFYNCSSFSGTLELPSSLKTIGGGSFSECSGFTGPLVLPDGLTELGDTAFGFCAGFSGDLVIPNSLTCIGNYAFWLCSGLNGQLILHDEMKDFGGSAFDGCSFQGELKLPANLTRIPNNCFYGCNFSSIAEFPEGLLSIDDHAFDGNTRLTGVLEFPESLVSLGASAFYRCSTLEGVVLPSDLGVIKSGAFINCYGLSKIVCRSTEPPIVQSGAFNGVAKDNFAVEVPESAVNRYQSASGWSEFKRIAAHHDFTISRRLMRTLNAEHSRELVLRAPSGQAWSVESCPEWVTVTPSSGVGKVEVTVTVNEMTDAEVGTFEIDLGTYNSHKYEKNNGRAGEVVFLLNDKDYRATLKVEQYDYEYGDGDVIVNQTATVGGGVNVVFMGDCFDARDIARGNYLAGVTEAIGYYFDIEPYKTYRDYFNVYTIFGMSNDSGMGTVNTIRDAKFGSQYSLEGITPNHATCYEYAMKADGVTEDKLSETLVVLIENTTDYGGICYMWGDGSAIACCPMSADAYPYDFRGIVQHEAGGHGFGKLADEYIYHNAFIQSCDCRCCDHLKEFYAGKALGWYRNLETTGDMDEVAWSHLIFHPKYSNIVDIYEGGYFHSRGIFRSEPVSCMNNNIPYYSAISRQEMVERIMRYAGEEFSLEEFYANDVLDIYGDAKTRAAFEPSLVISSEGAGKQLPPRYMGDRPQLNK
ncbi:MAG: leucine-rich repeat protein [Alistipes sp.]|nr:leucine-rich repeat protein [Alistipes sp.]